jgi:hypothetical protein
VPPVEVIDINATFPEIVDYERRIYAGMVRGSLACVCAPLHHRFSGGGGAGGHTHTRTHTHTHTHTHTYNS